MTVDKLNYLIVLAEEQNMTRAAKRLFITQPTLTAFINNVERGLGVKLFDRSHNPIRLTASGKVYIETMSRLVAAEQELNEHVRNLERQRKELKIGIGHIHSELWCPDFIPVLLEKYPFLNVQLYEAQELRIIDQLKKDEIDLLFGHLSIDAVNLHFEEICDEVLLLAIPENLMPSSILDVTNPDEFNRNSPEHPLPISPDAITSLPIIEPSSHQGLYLNLKQIMQQYHINPTRTIKTANMVTAGSLIQKGLGYMYFSPLIFSRVVVHSPQKIYYCTLPKMITSRKYYAAYKDSNPNIAIIKSAIQILKEVIANF